MCKRAWVVLAEYSTRPDRKGGIHVNQIASYGVPQDVLEIAFYKPCPAQSAAAFSKCLVLRHVAAPITAVGDIELSKQIRAVNAVEAKPVEINEPCRPGRRRQRRDVNCTKALVFLPVSRGETFQLFRTAAIRYFTSM